MKPDRIIKKFIVPHDKKISLAEDFDPGYQIKDLAEHAKELLQSNVQELAREQDKLYADNKWALLIIFQAMDAAGKDGTIKHVMSGLNPQGCQVASFKAPSSEELDHDYLWRCFKKLPERGTIGIFNRSYYEELLVVRVHPEILASENIPASLLGKGLWKRRFDEINNFEKYLTNNGIVVLKFFLNISKEEQRNRFLSRLELENKNWKFSTSDAREREYWEDYMVAYEDMFNHTSTKWAPWHIIPANHKPFAHLAVGYIIHETLKELRLDYPKVDAAQKKDLFKAKEILEKE
jgi:PPK2 family polyphosphate:nucleotide phosphotransferase